MGGQLLHSGGSTSQQRDRVNEVFGQSSGVVQMSSVTLFPLASGAVRVSVVSETRFDLRLRIGTRRSFRQDSNQPQPTIAKQPARQVHDLPPFP
jgi:hypothetical protein